MKNKEKAQECKDTAASSTQHTERKSLYLRKRMAQKGPSTALEDELSCPVCLEFFQDPVTLKCQHSVCRTCLETLTRLQETQHACPVCRRRYSMDNDRPLMSNMKLRNIVEAFLQRGETQGYEEKGLVLCVIHKKKHRLFCLECEVAVCAVCVETEQHSKHNHKPLKEEVAWRKRELTILLRNLPEKLEMDIKQARDSKEHAAKYIKTQAQVTARQIQSEFMKLYQFLKEEERARLTALKQDEERKTELLTERINRLTSDMTSLSEGISDIHVKMNTDDVSFLQLYKDLKNRVRCTMQAPQPVSGALIDVAHHLANLRFNVWEKMQEMVQYTPVTLDVNSAHPDLLISEALREVSDGQVSQPVPDNVERFDSTMSVLGSVGFCSGIHSWEVEVGPKKAWTLGVAKESVARKGNVIVSPVGGIWAIGLWNGEQYSAGTAPLGTPLVLTRKPQKVRVKLDYEKGELTFYDSSDMSVIYRFRDRFKDKLFPYFSPCLNSDGTNPGVLTICPEKVLVTLASAL
ncbi:E3 ubiquitin-protein ligase TRIM21 [Esox lucius]|uniref:Tripartite motif containing 35-12 n=1 Tax=Esox lucius TaxID=8010 RepID=A0A3P8YI27_ESOLU|nr:E3 ubiquitin-protein ligase TRIM21 [Esox lucius]